MAKPRLGEAMFGVLTVTDDEFDQGLRIFNAVEFPDAPYPYYVHSASDEAHPFVLAQAFDRGNPTAQSSARKMMELWRPEYILLVGTSGGIVDENGKGRDGVALGDIVVANFVEYTEFKKLAKRKMLSRRIAHDHPSFLLHWQHIRAARNSTKWVDWIGLERPDGTTRKPAVKVGSIAAGETIYSDAESEQQRAVVGQFDKALVVETESFGVARAVFEFRATRHYAPQYLTIRGVSDMIAADPEVERKEWTPYAASAALAFARFIIERATTMDFGTPGGGVV